MFETTLNKLNEFYSDAEALSARTYCENCFACLTAYIIYLCMDTHYEKVVNVIFHFDFYVYVNWLLFKELHNILLLCLFILCYFITMTLTF